MKRRNTRKHRDRAPLPPPPRGPESPVTAPVQPAPAPRRRPARRGRQQWLSGLLLPVLAVAAVAVLAYANAMPRATVHDDAFFVPARHQLSADSVVQIFREDTWASTGSPAGTYRPLTILSIAVNGAMFGSNPVGYHATNVALHALASVLVLLLVVELLGAAQAWPAVLAATIFAVHPIHTEAVDSIFNRSEILSTIGVVAALWVLARWHETRPVMAWTVAAVLYLFALLCRESGVTLPPLAAAMIWFQHADKPWRERLSRILPVACLVLPLAEYAMLRESALSNSVQAVAPALGVDTADDFVSRVLYSAASLREYARMLVWPHPLRMSYEDFVGGALVLTTVVHAVLVSAAVVLRRRAPMAALAVVFFYVALAPSTRVFTALALSVSAGDSPLLQLKNSLLLAERVTYLPSVALALSLAIALRGLARRHGLRVAAACAALPLAAGLLLTLERNRQWHSAVTLFAAEVAAAPENTDGWRLYVSALSGAERKEEAAAACDAQLERGGRSAQLFNNCGVVYDGLGRDDKAIASYQRAIEQGLATVGHANLGRTYARIGRMAEAEAEFAAAAESENDPARRHYRNGLLLARFHPERRAEARREFEAALALQPDFGAARQALSRLPR